MNPAHILVGFAALAVLGGGTISVATAAVGAAVPNEIHHRVEVTIDGTVTVDTDLDLEKFQPGQLIPDRVRIDGIPNGLTVRVPVSVDGKARVDGDHQVVCTGCPR